MGQRPLAIALCATCFAAFWATRGYARPGGALIYATATLFVFLNFNIVVWTYLYQPVFLLVALSALAMSRPQTDMPARASLDAES